MRRLSCGVLLAGGVALALVSSAPARALIAVPPGANKGLERVADADLIVTGQVLQVLDQDIKAPITKGSKAEVTYRIAVLKVANVIKGQTKGNILRVGFVARQQPIGRPGIRPLPAVPPGRPVPVPRPGIRPPYIGGVQLTEGMDGLFFLKKHDSGKFYTVLPFNGYVPSQNKLAFDTMVKLTRAAVRVVNDPKKGLRSEDRFDRLAAASMLVQEYRGRYSRKTQPIDPEESKLILKALRDADWDQTAYQYIYQANPQNLLSRLGINRNVGFNPPRYTGRTREEYQAYRQVYAQYAKNWIEKNLDNFRIERFVPQAGNPRPGPGGRPIQIQPVPVPPIQVLPVRPPIKIQPVRPRPPIQIRPIGPQPQPAGPGRAIQGRPVAPQPEPANPRIDRKDD